MSDDKVSLDFLGEQMLRMQADLRGVRSEQMRLESEQTSTRADLHRLETKVDGVDAKVDRLDAKVDAHDASNQARFNQVNETAAINLAITLEAIKALDRKIDDRG